MTRDKIIKDADDLNQMLIDAYELAGDLRDSFSHVKNNQGKLKDYCNQVRGNLHNIAGLRSEFNKMVNQIEEIPSR